MAKVKTCLWFTKEGDEAAKLYCSLIPKSRILNITPMDPEGKMKVIDLVLDEVPYTFFSMPYEHKLNDATSIVYSTDTQEETDRLWDRLLEGGGVELQCGWMRDRFGLTWQIVPKQLIEAISSSDRVAAGRAQAAMFAMKKIDIAAIEAAFKGE